jgi:PD-(D/E)XK nuclease superfamily
LNALPWSFSSLTAFETCARRYYHTRVVRDVLDAPGVEAQWGTEVHKHIEDRLLTGKQLPDNLRSYESFVAPLLTQGDIFVEKQLAVDSAFHPATWKGSSTWARGIVDVGVVSHSGTSAVLLDWKTGKRKPSSDQLMLFAGLAFANYPQLKRVSTAFVWLKDNKVDKEVFTRDDLPRIWGEFVPRVIRLERAYEQANFQPKPSGLCAKWCPVPRSKCVHSGTK